MSRSNGSVGGAILTLGAVILCSTCGYFVDDSDVCRAVTTQGYDGCTITERHEVFPSVIGGCSTGDAVAMDVSTKNSRNAPVTITVCCGWPSKGCTIRTH